MSDRKAPKTNKRTRTKAQRKSDGKAVVKAAQAEPTMGPKGGDRYETVQRDADVFRAWLRGMDVSDLAVTYGLTAQTVRDILNIQKLESQRITKVKPLTIVDDVVMQIDSAISELAAQAARTTGAARTQAVMARLNALFQKGRWLQACGVIPSEAQQLRVHIDAIGLADRLLNVLDEADLLTDELVDRIQVEFAETVEGTAVEIATEPIPDEALLEAGS